MLLNRKKYYVAGLLITIAVIALLFYLFSGKKELPPGIEPGREKEYWGYLKKWTKLAREGNVPMTFYGVVSDEEGRPVEGAKVEMSFSYWRTLTIGGPGVDFEMLETKKDGSFVFTGRKGFGVSVKEITKPGCEWVIGIRPSFKYRVPNEVWDFYDPDPNNPVKFTLRKKNLPELVFKDGNYMHYRVEYGKDFMCYDVILWSKWSLEAEEKGYLDEEIKSDGRFLHSDIMYKAEKIEKDGKETCVLTFKTPGEGNGVLKTDKILYTAPESGYQPEIKIELPFPKDGYEDEPQINVYFKLRTGFVNGQEKSIYARINGDINIEEDIMYLNFKSFVNPSGSRNLEYDAVLDHKGKKVIDENAVGFDATVDKYKAYLIEKKRKEEERDRRDREKEELERKLEIRKERDSQTVREIFLKHLKALSVERDFEKAGTFLSENFNCNGNSKGEYLQEMREYLTGPKPRDINVQLQDIDYLDKDEQSIEVKFDVNWTSSDRKTKSSSDEVEFTKKSGSWLILSR